MTDFIIRPLNEDDKEWVMQWVIDQWGASMVVAHGVVYYPHTLPGFAAFHGEQAVGLVTYSIEADSCEIVTINTLQPASGIGTALIEAVKMVASQSHCHRLWLMTTNDNLNALRFYQKRGFVLVSVHRNEMDLVRRLKPGVPLIGQDGIPLRDGIELEMMLDE